MMTNINTDERDISCKTIHKNKTTSNSSSSSSSSSRDVHFDEKDEKGSNNGDGDNSNNNDKKNGSNTNNNDNDANNTGSSSGDDPIHSVAIIKDRPRNARSISPALVANTSSGSSSSSKNTCTTPLLTPSNEDQDEWDSDSDQSHFTETLKFTSTFSRSPQPEGDSSSNRGIRRRNRKSRRNEPKSMGLNYNYGMEKEGDKWLVIIILCYTVITQLAGFCLFLFFSRVDNNMKTAIADHDDRSGMFWLFFMSVTSFTNLGFNFWSDGLNNNNLSKSPGLVLTMSILILSGNTCIPIFVRFWVWTCRNLSSQRNKPKYLQSLRGKYNIIIIT